MFELAILLSRYLFVIYIIYFLWQGAIYILYERDITLLNPMLAVSKQRVTIIFFHLTGFLILAYVPNTFTFAKEPLIFAALSLAFLIFALISSQKVYPKSCQLIWNCILFLMDIGLVMLYRLDTALAEKQLMWIFLGFVTMLFIPLVLKWFPKPENQQKLYLFFSWALILLPSLAGVRQYGAVNWLRIGGFSFQPSEMVKFLLIFYLASTLKTKKEKIYEYLLPAVMCGGLVLVLVYQRDLGGALIFFLTFMLMLYVASGSELIFAGGMVGASAASYVGYHLFDHVKVRVNIWLDPWQSVTSDGYQVVQSLFAIGTWGVFGSGLTLGYARVIPVVAKDFIYAAICEEFGGLFALGVIGVFILLFFRGVVISLRCNNRFFSLVATGTVAMMSIQTFLILGGVTKFIPLTGVTLPFICYGGTSIFVSILMVGLLQWIHSYIETSARGEEESYE